MRWGGGAALMLGFPLVSGAQPSKTLPALGGEVKGSAEEVFQEVRREPGGAEELGTTEDAPGRGPGVRAVMRSPGMILSGIPEGSRQGKWVRQS